MYSRLLQQPRPHSIPRSSFLRSKAALLQILLHRCHDAIRCGLVGGLRICAQSIPQRKRHPDTHPPCICRFRRPCTRHRCLSSRFSQSHSLLSLAVRHTIPHPPPRRKQPRRKKPKKSPSEPRKEDQAGNHPPTARQIAHRGRQTVSAARLLWSAAAFRCGRTVSLRCSPLAMRPCCSSPRLLSLAALWCPGWLVSLLGACAQVSGSSAARARGMGCSSGLPSALQTCRAAEAGYRAASRRGQLAACASCANAPHAVALPPRIPAPWPRGRRVVRGRAAYAGARWPPWPLRCSLLCRRRALRPAPRLVVSVASVRRRCRPSCCAAARPFSPRRRAWRACPPFPRRALARPLCGILSGGTRGSLCAPAPAARVVAGFARALPRRLLWCAPPPAAARPVGPCRAVCAPASPRAPVGWWRAAPLSLSASRWQ